MLKIEKYTFGTGDRFAHQGRAQLRAILQARDAGIDVYPVWNKSNREHAIIKSKHDDVRAEVGRRRRRPCGAEPRCDDEQRDEG